ncbi:SPOR domain-containing protein [Wenzhouxiangella sp. AB-CW3]|nr:SPOR domain-containing protein [Wenzhouxiangella sp. AB-CW3]QOC22903.1 SPOR domain-containing protein [Wenzhouxiangella sp. AB-CW3]
MMPWRWMALGLLLLNIAAGFGFLLSDPVVETDAPDMPPLAADVNQPPLVSEVSQFEPDASQAPACYSIGPLPTLLAQQRGEDRLRAFVSDLRLRQTTADHDRGWWVYLSTSSRSEALQLTRELAEADVEDYYVVAGGEMENAVSVGLFQSIENARRRQARMQELGFNAQMEVRRERIPQFWIDYRVTPGDEPPWRFILRASPGAQRMSIPCFTTSGDNATREPSA